MSTASHSGGALAAAGEEKLQEERFSPFLRVTFRSWTKWYLEGTESFWPFSDLIVRFFIGMWFLRSGLVKAAGTTSR